MVADSTIVVRVPDEVSEERRLVARYWCRCWGIQAGGKLIAPMEETGVQTATFLNKVEQRMSRQVICEVLHIPLRG